MNQIIKEYFSDSPTSDDYSDKNIFYPPATLKMISEVEEAVRIKFPDDYVSFLQITNGYEGKVGQSHSVFIAIDKVEEYTKHYGGDFFPWVIVIGGNGGGEMYVIDKRNKQLTFGLLPYISEENDFIPLGETFEEFVKHLYYNDFW